MIDRVHGSGSAYWMYARLIPAFLLLVSASVFTQAQNPPQKNTVTQKKWPSEVVRVEMQASDGEVQPAMWYTPESDDPKPLLVGLHTWSSSYHSAAGDAIYAEWCVKEGWAFIHPHFRGPNMTPQAMGSDRAVQDIVEAVEWAKSQTAIDTSRIYLIGGSGGGHMAMLTAGRHPEIWAGVSAWCGITDIKQWYRDHLKGGVPDHYAKHIESALGGSPLQNEKLEAEALKRSPLTWLHQAKGVPLDINHGIHDGRTGSVPFTHSLLAFNATIGEAPEHLPVAEIASYYETQKLPLGWQQAEPDAVYGLKKPLFRRVSNNTRITLFEGGHDLVHQAALNWLSAQRKGQPAVWQISNFIKLEQEAAESSK